MRKIRSKRGFTLGETLTAIAIAALLAPVCLFGITASTRAMHAASTRMRANALADTAAPQIKNEIRFAKNPSDAIASLNDYTASLGDLSVEALTFEKRPNGSVVFRFTVAGISYAYETMPLNRDFVRNSDSETP